MEFNEVRPGISVQNEEIRAFISIAGASKFTYLIAGVHGDEIEGIFVLQKLFDWLKEENFDKPIVVVPALNVDAIKTNERTNSNGVDLNRNWGTSDWCSNSTEKKYYPGLSPLSEPENQFLKKLFAIYPPSLIISFHTWKPLINYNGDCKHIAEYISKHNHYEITSDIGYKTPGSLGTYGAEKLNCGVLTFECPSLDTRESLDAIWEENETALKKLLKNN